MVMRFSLALSSGDSTLKFYHGVFFLRPTLAPPITGWGHWGENYGLEISFSAVYQGRFLQSILMEGEERKLSWEDRDVGLQCSLDRDHSKLPGVL